MPKPFAFIAHKDNHWAGVCSPDVSDLKDFLGDFAAEGFTITPVADRAEYESTLAGMSAWHDHPECKAKRS
jgi:hypothetical protein